MGTVSLLVVAVLAAIPTKPVPKPAPDLRCGGYCLYVGLRALDYPISSYDEIERRLGQPTAVSGYSLGQLNGVAKDFGVQTLGVSTTPERLAQRPGRFVALAHIDGNHFVNIAGVDNGAARIIDPPREYSLPVDTLRTRWDGTALLLSREPLLAEEKVGGLPSWSWVAAALAGVAVVVGAWAYLSRRKPAGLPTSAR